MQEQERGPFERGASAKTDEMLVDELLFSRGEPSDIERQRWQATVKIPEFRPRKNAQDQRRESFDRMLHLAHESALQADHVSRQRVVQDLAATIIKDLVTKGPSLENGVQMFAVSAFAEKAYTGLDAQFVHLERFDELELFPREFAQAGASAQWAQFARRVLSGMPSVSKNHENPQTNLRSRPRATLMKRRLSCPT
jgi:hypothetical protein